MGLDISVYKNIRPSVSDEDYEFTAFVVSPEWEYKIKNLVKDAQYAGERVKTKVSYSYSMHSRFREFLINLIGRTDLLENGRIRWENLTSDIPFFDLIDFADNEGCIDWETSEKILSDFRKYKLLAGSTYDRYMASKYLDWEEVFEIATREKGVVVFS